MKETTSAKVLARVGETCSLQPSHHNRMSAGSQRAQTYLLCMTGLLSCAGAFAASPLTPEQERATFRMADEDLVVELVAAEPEVRAPVAIAWDADGRLFVAEMTDYPLGPVSGRIRVLEAPDANGRYQRATIFATNLAYPNGVMPWKQGVLVTAAPDIWYLADTNGDGTADVREKILTGFAEGNQQLRVNGLYWGIDNWIYGANGRSDGEAAWADGAKAGSIRRHDFRFRPDTRQFEPVAGNSQFGMGHDDWGNRFPVFNATPIRHVVMEERQLARQPLLAGADIVPGISPANEGNRVFAVTPPNVLIPQPIGFFTSACGPSIYRGTALPESYDGNYFVCEPVQNVVQRRILKPSGSTFVAEYAHTNHEFLASGDPWFHGVFTATGPDGALYVVDFYRDFVEHPQWVAPELRDKVDWRKGEEHGRIWRVRSKKSRPAPPGKLSALPSLELVKALESDNGWIRDTAHRLLVERAARTVVPALERLARTARKPQTRIHVLNALATLHGREAGAVSSSESQSEAVGGLEAVLFSALGDPSPRVREQAVRLAEENLGTNATRPGKWLTGLSALTRDSDARVRLQVAGVFGRVNDDAARCDALARLAGHEQLDEWQSLAILGSEARPWKIVSRVAARLSLATAGQVAFLERAAGLIAAGTNQEDKRELLTWLADWKSPERLAVAAVFANGLRAGERLETIAPNEMLARQIRGAAVATARDRKAPLKIRIATVQLIPPAEAARLVGSAADESLQVAAARAVLESGDAETVRRIFDSYPELAKPLRRQIVVSSARSRIAALELERAVVEQKVPLLEIDPITRQALEKFADAEVKSRAIELFKSAVSPDRDAVVQKYRAALRLAGNRKHGAEIFERTCAVCHQMQGVGAKVGPDLSGTGQQPRETLLMQILDPSRQVLPDFVAYNVTTRNGESYSGFIANESAGTLTLRRANEPDVTFPRTDLQSVQTSGKSLMPDGLEAGLSEQDVADLIEFLRRPDRTLFTQTK
jgi:putative membrane-bound dehydrogenase-like protein